MERAEPERTLTRSGLLGSPSFFLVTFSNSGYVLRDLFLELRGILLAVLIVIVASFGGDGEASRHREANFGHLGEACAFAAEQIAPGTVTFRFTCSEEINPFSHCIPRI